MLRDRDKVVFITGTSSGFGLLTSVELAADGCLVVASMRDTTKSERLMQLAAEKNVADRITIVPLDVTNEAQVESVILETIDRFGRIDVLINNAGIGGHGFIEEIPLTAWRSTFDTNLFGPLACIRVVLPSMRAQKSGMIINIGSISGRRATPGAGPYAASKFALEAVSESLRLEMAPFGVKVAIVEPSLFKTDIWKKANEFHSYKEGSPYMNRIESLRKWAASNAENSGDPMEVVDLIREILATGAPALRYPIGRVGDQTVEAVIRGHLTTPWENIERSQIPSTDENSK